MVWKGKRVASVLIQEATHLATHNICVALHGSKEISRKLVKYQRNLMKKMHFLIFSSRNENEGVKMMELTSI